MEIAVLGLSKAEEIELGLKSGEKKYGIKVKYLSPTISELTSGKLEEVIPAWQISTIKELLSSEIKGIALVPLHPEPISQIIKEVTEKGIFLITYDIDAPETERILHIGTNHYLAGKIAANTLVPLLNFRGNIVIDTPSLTSKSCKERIEGFKEAISKYPNIKILEIFSCKENIAEIFSIPQKILSTYKDIQAIFSVTGIVASADAETVKFSNRKEIKIVCVDAEKDTIKFLNEGIIQIIIAQRNYLIGEKIVEILYRMIKFGKEIVLKSVPSNKFIDTGVDVVTKENLLQFLKSQESKGIKY